MFDAFRFCSSADPGREKLLSKFGSLVVTTLSVVLVSGCAHISIQPKDPQLLSLEQFARDVTVHLKSVDPKNYEQYQHKLGEEITPGVLRQLRQRGDCAKSPAEIKAKVQAMNKANQAALVKIDTAEFPAKATETGLVPVEIKGSVITIGADGKERPPAKFDLLYLVGTNKVNHKFVIASIQIKQ
ncbi:MAG: hypothetical protein C5B53_03965 [Candidatus Melainabacteria bacterium]|nr:MAG: hypothetical protein C5B53_03965 [Candidatus Melainabacteria bacterium]